MRPFKGPSKSEGPRYDAGFRVTQGSGFAFFGMENTNWPFLFSCLLLLGFLQPQTMVVQAAVFPAVASPGAGWARLGRLGRGLGEAWARPGKR